MNSMTGSYSASCTARQVKAAGDLDPGVLQAFRQGPQRSGSDDVTAFDRDQLASGDRRHGNQPAALDLA